MFIFQLFTFILVILGLVVSTRRVVVRGGIQVVRVDVEGLERGPDTGAKPVARHHNGGHKSASLWGKPGLGIGMWNVVVKDISNICFIPFVDYKLLYDSHFRMC